MPIREYTAADLAALEALHRAQGFAYAFPDLEDPLFVSKLVAEGADGGVAGAVLLRLTCEAYLLLDPRAGTPRERWTGFLALHDAAARDAWAKGLADVHAWLPPPIARRFGRRIESLGWVRDTAWTPYCKKLAPA